MKRIVFAMAVLAAGTMPTALTAQVEQETGAVTIRERPDPAVLRARRVGGMAPEVDGVLDEGIWIDTDDTMRFVQREPDDGSLSRARTSVQVWYDEGALYVGMRMFDPHPDSIGTALTRRDVQSARADWAHVYIDSYFDRRTAFRFSVNASGVKVDALHFGDTQEDVGWDAVWTGAARIDAEGWTAEFRIPVSQLRFAEGDDLQWGVNFGRTIARYGERSFWSAISAEGSGFVSRFGTLVGLEGLATPSRLEVRPYTVSSVTRAPVPTASPFASPTALTGNAGVDVKYGVTSDFTLQLAVNPDFGQVEADPSVVNLSAFETFLPEKRPFFLEGADLFQVAYPTWPPMFYSRRIGRAPTGSLPAGAGVADVPDATTILAAAKLTGKTPGGLSIGVFNALTGQETARFVDGANLVQRSAVEPATNYTVARVSQDFRGGQSAIGGIATVMRRVVDAGPLTSLRSSAVVGGVDGRHRFGDGRHEAAGSVMGSVIAGSHEAMIRAQRAPGRYFQRPDARHVVFDSTRTGLSGTRAALRFAKVGGGHLRWEVNGSYMTPGYDQSDLGFQFGADQATVHARLGFDQFRPQGPFRRWRVDGLYSGGWTTAGERRHSWVQLFGNAQFKNYWNVNVGLDRTFDAFSVDALRGGPALRTDGYVSGWFGLDSDTRRSVNAGLFLGGQITDGGAGSWLNVAPRLTIRPSSRLEVGLQPRYNRMRRDDQYVRGGGAPALDSYVFGGLEQTTVALVTRLNYTFSPTASLELYAQPFMSAGRYTDFVQVVDPEAVRFDDRFVPVADLTEGPQPGQYQSPATGVFGNPDFHVAQMRSNVVFRWEYRAGSTVYLVWSQDRSMFTADPALRVTRNLADLLGAPGRNVLLLKIDYWFAR